MADRGVQVSPVPVEQRLEVIDVIRGFALFGVLLANLIWLSQDVALTSGDLSALPTAGIDRIVRGLVRFLVDGKFYTIFAFLFGLGFSLQMRRVSRAGSNPAPLFIRRMVVLLLIGLAHTFLLWYGDILHVYALAGLFLLLFRPLTGRTLLYAAMGFAVVLPVTVQIVQDFAPGFGPLTDLNGVLSTWFYGDAVWTPHTRFAAFRSGDYVQMLRANAEVVVTGVYLSGYAWHYLPATLGKFVLGFYAGRVRLFERMGDHPLFFERMLRWGFILGIAGSGSGLLVNLLQRTRILSAASLWASAFYLPITVGALALAGAYVAAVVLLYRRPHWKQRLDYLAPVGRMALTNYLLQTITALLLFYGFGFGLLGRIGAAACVPLAVLIFLLQVILSNAWLTHFRYGPAEWLWRSITYRSPQPFRTPSRQESCAGAVR